MDPQGTISNALNKNLLSCLTHMQVLEQIQAFVFTLTDNEQNQNNPSLGNIPHVKTELENETALTLN